jgi:hypothetical protein
MDSSFQMPVTALILLDSYIIYEKRLKSDFFAYHVITMTGRLLKIL